MPANALRDFAVPLRTLDPDDPDVSDLQPLRGLVGEARVVSIGENAHCAREFYQLKDRMLRFLVSELGFSAFVMESGFPEGLAVDEWVLGGAGDLEHIANTGITYRFGECAEMRAQLQWMRDWNAKHDRKVRFYGMDVPGSAANPRAAIEACLRRLEPRPGDAALLELADLGERFQAMVRYATMAAADRQHLSAGIAELVERALVSGDEIAYRCALGAQRLDECVASFGRSGPGASRRDELMADNIRWILQREERIVIGAHNVHVERAPWQGSTMLGQLLASVLGKKMVIIGTTFASGEVIEFRRAERPISASLETMSPPPPHTIDSLMDAAGYPLHLVDLRQVPSERIAAATAMRLQTQLVDIDAKEAFDALVHVRHITTVPEAFEKLRDSLARARLQPRTSA